MITKALFEQMDRLGGEKRKITKKLTENMNLKESIDKKYIVFDHFNPDTLYFVKNIPDDSWIWDSDWIIEDVTDKHGNCLIQNDDESISVGEMGNKTLSDLDKELVASLKKAIQENPDEDYLYAYTEDGEEFFFNKDELPHDLDSMTPYSDRVEYSYVDGDSSSQYQVINLDTEEFGEFGVDIFVDEDQDTDEGENQELSQNNSNKHIDSFWIENGKIKEYEGKKQNLIIPEGITTISGFFDNKYLRKVYLPSSVKIIDDYAFSYCYNLSQINFSENLQSIGKSAFINCEDLTNVILPNSITTIGEEAFAQCYSLQKVFIPNSVKNIGKEAFRFCRNLTICCEAESKPEGWDKNWNISNAKIIWGYKDSKIAESVNIKSKTNTHSLKEDMLEDNSGETESWMILKTANSQYIAISDDMDDLYANSFDEIKKKIEKKAYELGDGYDFTVESINFNNKPNVQLVGEMNIVYKYVNNDLKESKKSKALNPLKESLNPKTYDRINHLIKECLKEGMEVEISIPKSQAKNKLNESSPSTLDKLYNAYPMFKSGSPEELQYLKEIEARAELKRILETKLQDLEDHIRVMSKKHIPQDDILEVFSKYSWVGEDSLGILYEITRKG